MTTERQILIGSAVIFFGFCFVFAFIPIPSILLAFIAIEGCWLFSKFVLFR